LLLNCNSIDFIYLFSFFCFQAEDGIRDRNVTGVQTCALPICHDCDTTTVIVIARTGVALITPGFAAAVRLDERGRLELPSDVRRHPGLNPGDEIITSTNRMARYN